MVDIKQPKHLTVQQSIKTKLMLAGTCSGYNELCCCWADVAYLRLEGEPFVQIAEMVKNKSQTYGVNLLEKARAQPHALKTWEVTASAAFVGAVAMAATAPSLLALLSLLATPPVAMTVGGVGGGVWGWYYMRKHQPSRAGSTEKATAPCTTTDDLERIAGISPLYASRLHAAGIFTFAQLGALTPERVHLIIGPTYHDKVIQSRQWIAQARAFAEQAPMNIAAWPLELNGAATAQDSQ